MFNELINDLKYCKRVLHTVANDGKTDSLNAHMIQCVIRRIEDSLYNLNMPKKRRDAIKFETGGELLEFLLGLSDRDLNKCVKIGRNEYDFSSKWGVKVFGYVQDVDWVRKDDESILICCK